MLWLGISAVGTRLADTMITLRPRLGKTRLRSRLTFLLWLYGWLGAIAWAAVMDLPPASPSGELVKVGATKDSIQDAAKFTKRTIVKGVVTWIDVSRGLVVLQDGEHARALRVDLPQLNFDLGDTLSLGGIASPLIVGLPDYPIRPAGVELLPSFETPTNWNRFCVSRLRGYLCPPASGNYTFWIASDDSSELWLGVDETSGRSSRIASVGTGRYAQYRAWDTHASQKSRVISLVAGKRYYIEALHQDNGGVNFLSVAWEGPGLERTLIAGRYLLPFKMARPVPNHQGAGTSGALGGITWEFWTNFYSADLSVLRITNEFITNLMDSQVERQGQGVMPGAAPLRLNEVLRPEQNFQLVEMTGQLGFTSETDGAQTELELLEGGRRVRVRIAGSPGARFIFPERSLLRVRGVCEATRGADGELRPSVIWVSGATNIWWVDTEDNWQKHKTVPVHTISASNPGLHSGQLLRLQGTVVGPAGEGLWRMQADDVIRGYASEDGSNWREVGTPIEMRLPPAILAGFAVSSHSTNLQTTAKFDSVSGLRGPLQGAQLGAAESAGTFDFAGDKLRIAGAGWNIWSVADQCYFSYAPLEGDGQIVARLQELQTPDRQGRAVLMMRETLNESSAWAGIVRRPENLTGLQARRESKGLVAGAIAADPAKWFKLTRQRKSFLIQPQGDESLAAGQVWEAMGRLEWRGDEIVLDHARLRRMVKEADAPNEQATVAGAAPTVVDEIRDVPIGALVAADKKAELEARLARFRIRGVITYIDQNAGNGLFFVQDESGACLIRLWAGTPRQTFAVGQQVELVGTVAARGGLPEFAAMGCAITGIGELPTPLRHPFESDAHQVRRGQWVELEGVGRRIGNEAELILMTREGLVSVQLDREFAPAVTPWINSLMRVRGVYWNNPKPMLLVASPRFVEVGESSPDDPFAVPAFSIATLLNQELEEWSTRRQRIAGVVTCTRDDRFVVQDATGGICVETDEPPEVAVGDKVEVVGFFAKRATGCTLSESLIRKLGKAVLPPAIELSAEIGWDQNKNTLTVAIEAVLLQTLRQGGLQTLDLQAEQRAFRAFLPVKDGSLPQIANGSKVRVMGVSQIEGGNLSKSSDGTAAQPLVAKLELLLRTPADLVVVERPPWWNWKYTAALIGLSIAGGITSLVWIRTLRRRVQQRTVELCETMSRLQKETQVSATLAERDRLAAEIHDSVEQGLSAIIMQMDTAEQLVERPGEMKRFLKMVRDMAGFCRAEVHHAVWSMQSPLLDNADLPAALKRIAGDINTGGSLRVIVRVNGELRKLPAQVEHHLLRAGQEAITNAVKHASPSTIEVTLSYLPDSVRLRVHDNGHGFDPKAVRVGISHFGLQGLHTRTKKIRGELTITSQPGEGAAIEIVVPLNKPAALGDENIKES